MPAENAGARSYRWGRGDRSVAMRSPSWGNWREEEHPQSWQTALRVRGSIGKGQVGLDLGMLLRPVPGDGVSEAPEMFRFAHQTPTGIVGELGSRPADVTPIGAVHTPHDVLQGLVGDARPATDGVLARVDQFNRPFADDGLRDLGLVVNPHLRENLQDQFTHRLRRVGRGRITAVLPDAGQNVVADPASETLRCRLIAADDGIVETRFGHEGGLLLSAKGIDDLTSSNLIRIEAVSYATDLVEGKEAASA